MPLDAPTHAPPHPRASAFVPLDGRLLRQAFDRDDRLRGWTTRVEATTPSTNATLLQALRQNTIATPCVLTTDDQSEGRGRRGRAWRSAPGASLTVSFGFASERDLVALQGVTLAYGLAVRDVLATLGVDARLKWPNDLVVDGRKLAGILVESLQTTHTLLVIGIGINIAPLADDETHDYRAIDLATCGVTSCDRHRLVAALAASLAARMEVMERTGFASMVAEYDASDAFLGRRVSLSRADGSMTTGIERGVDARGALRVDADSERVTIVAGDVSLRLADA